MNSKLEKFIGLSNIYKLFSQYQNSIFLIVHLNNMNTIQKGFIESYCKKHSVQAVKVKSNLVKKVVYNNLFLNLFAGPTSIYIFNDFPTYLNFFNMPLIEQKLIPLTIYWQNNFFSYSFFNTFLLLEVYKNRTKVLTILDEQTKVLLNVSNPFKTLLINLKLLSMFSVLNLYKNNKLKNENVDIKSIN